MKIDPPQDLVELIERLRAAVAAVKANDRDWERGAIAARWLDFEIAPLLETFDVAAIVDEIAKLAIDDNTPRDIMPMGTGETRCPPGVHAQITGRPQRTALRIDRIFVDRRFEDDFLVHDVIIGNRSQFAQSGPIPASALARRCHAFDVVQTAMDLVFVVEYVGGNPDGEPFISSAEGHSVDDWRAVSAARMGSDVRIGNVVPMLSASQSHELIDAFQGILVHPAPRPDPFVEFDQDTDGASLDDDD